METIEAERQDIDGRSDASAYSEFDETANKTRRRKNTRLFLEVENGDVMFFLEMSASTSLFPSFEMLTPVNISFAYFLVNGEIKC